MRQTKSYEDYGIKFNDNGAEEQYANCPKCSTQRKKKRVKCLSVNVRKQVWTCHHCGWAGTLKGGGHYSDPFYQKPDYKLPKLLPVNADIPAAVQKWFLGRGITMPTLIRNKIQVIRVYMPQVEEFVPAITFPYFRDEKHINSKYRDKNKNFRMEAGAELILYGLDDIKEAKQVIFVEGEMDKLSLEEAGYSNCVSMPNGAPAVGSKNFNAHFDHLTTAESYLQDKQFIIFVDADEAGQNLEAELARRLGRENCLRVKLPDGYKDANEYLMAFGRDALKDVVDNAKPYPVTGIHTANTLVDGVMRLHDGGLKRGVSTGWVALDYFFSIKAGEMTIVTGIPNHGKSFFLDCMFINIAKMQGWRVGVFSPENQPLERHAAGYVEKYNKKPFNDIGIDYVTATMDWLHKHFYWILPDLDDDWTIDAILDKAKTLVYRHGINLLVIDPYNEIEHRRPVGMSETDYISVFLSKIRNFARFHRLHIFVVAHPTKMRKDEKTGLYPPPTPYDIANSANWRNKADNALTVYRDFANESANIVWICIQKIRFQEVGKLGICKLVFDPQLQNYRELSHDDK